MRYPVFVRKGDTLGFAAPSFGCATEPYNSAFVNALEKLKKKGFEVQLGPNCFENSGCGISNLPELCAKELMELYEDPKNTAILSCGGGELMCEILPYMDFDRIRRAPAKWFMGFSDNTNFTFLSALLCDTAAVYGNNAPSFGMEPWHRSLGDSLKLLQGTVDTVCGYASWEKEGIKDAEHPLLPYHLTEKTKYLAFLGRRELNISRGQEPVVLSGRLMGGCMDCLSHLVGTRFDQMEAFHDRYGQDGIIWFLEACDLSVLEIRRTLWQMREAGWFRNAAGFLIGRPYCFGQEIMGVDQYTAVTEILGDLNIPILMDLDIGHLPPRIPVITGATARIVCSRERFSVTYTWK